MEPNSDELSPHTMPSENLAVSKVADPDFGLWKCAWVFLGAP